MTGFKQQIPHLGYGTWDRAGDVAYRGVFDALTLGYRHIDTAQAYSNEIDVGKALAASGLDRDAYFLTTKVDPINFGPGQVAPSVERSLEHLQVNSVDLLLLHFPSLHDEYEAEDYISQLGEVYENGYAKFIGVSNFTKHYLDIALDVLGEGLIANNQVEIHAYMQNQAIVDYCRSLDIVTTAYSPLARGALIKDPVLQGIASELGGTSSQVALAFLLAEGHVVIPSSVSQERAASNLAASKLTLSSSHVDAIRALERGMRLVDEDWCPKWDI
ncbi:aldo/keto reductase [Agaribacter marinus]|uniref:2,5-diketo-D-gluconate reductase B n=1 Tax=Agaribacter marinus TaxID=1431249 RepID=A0AA37T4K7_9ALTE|nr:aldo/keto reductase [Agaribacter marinus]GLR71933.1 2,5-diketo-D-gluconate reductase B [Agaribacter marinus]